MRDRDGEQQTEPLELEVPKPSISQPDRTGGHTHIRWVVLALLCVNVIGQYYCYDIPTALNPKLEQYFNGTTNYEGKYALLYSLYSYPNTVLPFVGGALADRLGFRTMAVIFSALLTLGQVVFALGVSLHADGATSNLATSWSVMWAGRALFGIGGESLYVARSAMVAQWFAGKELALALGVLLALSRLSSVLNDWASLQLAADSGVPAALWFGALLCAVSLAAAVAVYAIDRSAQPSSPAVPADAASPLDLRAVWRFPIGFWLVCGCCFCGYSAITPFNNVASAFLVTKYKLHDAPLDSVPVSEQNQLLLQANTTMMVTFLTAGLLSPLIGAAIDRCGHRATIVVIGGLVLSLVHALLGFTFTAPGPLLIGLGLTMALFSASLWPSIALLIHPKQQGTAYGVTTAVQNLGLAVVPQLVALLQQQCSLTYTCVEEFFFALGLASVALALALWVWDSASSPPVLNLPAAAAAGILAGAWSARGSACAGDQSASEDPGSAEGALLGTPLSGLLEGDRFARLSGSLQGAEQAPIDP